MKILGTGSCLPKRIVTNDELSEIVDTNDEWISTRTGIRTRRISAGETASDLASKAALAALQDAGISPKEVDMILLATMTGNALMPNTACLVQKNIGAENAACVDVNAACSGFLYAMNLANACLVSGMYKNILVIGAETLSKIIDWADRSTCVLFGDGAGAAVVTGDLAKRYISETGADGKRGDALKAGETGVGNFIVRREEKLSYYMAMNGQEVFKFAVKKVPECISSVLAKAGASLDEIDYFLLHQANVRIIASVAKRLGVDMEKMPVNLDRYGNTSAASIAILLDETRREGKLTKGKKIILAGFGGGLTWGAAYMEL